jgi:hypothetical protein
MVVADPALVLIVLAVGDIHVRRLVPLATTRLQLLVAQYSLKHKSIRNTYWLKHFFLLLYNFSLSGIKAVDIGSSSIGIKVFNRVLNSVEPSYVFIRPAYYTLSQVSRVFLI